MKYTLTGGAGHITKPLALQLLKAGHQVTVVGRSEANLKELADAGAKAAVGSIEDVAFLTNAFTGADAVYTMVPPKWDAADWKGYIGGIGKNYAAAVKAAGVKHVVNLSSLGAHMPDGCGPVSGLHRVETELNNLEDVAVKHLRPAYFYQNLLANIGLVKHAGIIGGNFGEPGSTFVIVHPNDIAAVAAEELLGLAFTGHSVRYIASDEIAPETIAATLGEAIGKPQLPWVVFADEQAYQGMVGAGLSEEVARNYVEMGTAIRSGAMTEDYFKHKPVLGKVKIADFAKEFTFVYNSGEQAGH